MDIITILGVVFIGAILFVIYAIVILRRLILLNIRRPSGYPNCPLCRNELKPMYVKNNRRQIGWECQKCNEYFYPKDKYDVYSIF